MRAIVLAVILAAVCFTAGICWYNATEPKAQEPYAGGRLIDITGSIVYEEDGDCFELGRRLVTLASGKKFTEDQVEQLSELVADLFAYVRNNAIGIDELEWRLDKLEEE